MDLDDDRVAAAPALSRAAASKARWTPMLLLLLLLGEVDDGDEEAEPTN